MLKSLSDTVNSWWQPKLNVTTNVSERKRKRPEIDTYEEDSDVEIVSVKKPRQESTEATSGFLSRLSTKMSQMFWKATAQEEHFNVRPILHDSRWNRAHIKPESASEQQKLLTVPRGSLNFVNGTDHHIERHESVRRLARASIHNNSNGNTEGVNGDMFATHDSRISSSSSRRSSCSSYRLGSGRKKTTADQCFQLKQREEYRKLLQQFTNVQLEYQPGPQTFDQPKDIIQSRPSRSVPPLPAFFHIPSSASSVSTSSDISSIMSAHHWAPKSRVIPSRFVNTPSRFVNAPLLSEKQRDQDEYPSLCRTPAPSLQRFLGPLPATRPFLQNHKPETQQRPSLSEPQRDSISIKPAYDDVVILDDEEFKREEKLSIKPPSFTESEFLKESWLKEWSSKYEISERERQAEIREAELTRQLYEKRRDSRLCNLDKELRQKMKLFDEEPEVIEEKPIELPEEKPLPELTDSMLKEIKAALDGGNPTQVLSEGFRLKITRNDIATLRGLNWLNDEIINFYMNMLMERGEQQGFEKTYCFNTFFYPKLLSGGHAAVRRWTRSVDLFAHSYLVIPVHLGVHWCLCVVFMKHKKIVYYDSMGGANNNCLNAVRQYLHDESLQKRNIKLDLTEWETEIAREIPQQMNGSDCGMFSCMYAETLTRGAAITFTQNDMPYFRRRMVYEILKKKLL